MQAVPCPRADEDHLSHQSARPSRYLAAAAGSQAGCADSWPWAWSMRNRVSRKIPTVTTVRRKDRSIFSLRELSCRAITKSQSIRGLIYQHAMSLTTKL